MAAIIIGAFLIAGAVIVAIPGVIDSFYEWLRPLYRVYGNWQYNWSLRLARIWMPLLLLAIGLVVLLKGIGVLH